MNIPSATIRIKNLRLRTFIGFNDDEKNKKQDIVVNIDIRYSIHNGVYDDKVQSALNYKTITKDVINLVEENRFLLLEKLTADILQLCSQNPTVEHAVVQVDKPHALRFADSVSLTLEYDAKVHYQTLKLEKAS